MSLNLESENFKVPKYSKYLDEEKYAEELEGDSLHEMKKYDHYFVGLEEEEAQLVDALEESRAAISGTPPLARPS
jgi:hypothetical protein